MVVGLSCYDCGESHHDRNHFGVLAEDTDWVCQKCVARKYPPLPGSVSGELLFTEGREPGRSPGQARGGHGGQPQRGQAPGQALPSYQDSWDEFDSVMDQYGMERSPSQPKTKGDGNCAVYGKQNSMSLTFLIN